MEENRRNYNKILLECVRTSHFCVWACWFFSLSEETQNMQIITNKQTFLFHQKCLLSSSSSFLKNRKKTASVTAHALAILPQNNKEDAFFTARKTFRKRDKTLLCCFVQWLRTRYLCFSQLRENRIPSSNSLLMTILTNPNCLVCKQSEFVSKD